MTDRLSLTSAKNIIKHISTPHPINESIVANYIGSDWYVISTEAINVISLESDGIVPKATVESPVYKQAVLLTAKKLFKEAKKENKTKFVFSMHSEGFTYVDLKFYSDCFEYMKGFDGYEFAHAYGAHPHLLNKQYLRKHYANLKLCEGIKILLINHFELMMQGYLLGIISDEAKKEFEQLNSTPTVKPYKFLLYNNYPKLNRTYLVGQLVHRNLESQGLISLNLGHALGEGTRSREHQWEGAVINKMSDTILNEYFPRTGKEIFNSMIENKEKMMSFKPLGTPRWELADGEYDSYCGLDADGRDHVRSAYFGVTVETKYFHDRNTTLPSGTMMPNTLDTLYVDCITFTEKTYKFISGKIPFILVGMPKSLHVLRDSGYKTFQPYINEDYDNIEDDELRLVAIADEIERLCGLSDDEWLEIQRELIPRIEHNYQLLLKSELSVLQLTEKKPN